MRDDFLGAGFAGNGDQPCGVQIIGSALQVSEQLHLSKPATQQAIFEFTSGIDRMFKAEASSVAVSY
jgi:hypothetical protein